MNTTISHAFAAFALLVTPTATNAQQTEQSRDVWAAKTNEGIMTECGIIAVEDAPQNIGKNLSLTRQPDGSHRAFTDFGVTTVRMSADGNTATISHTRKAETGSDNNLIRTLEISRLSNALPKLVVAFSQGEQRYFETDGVTESFAASVPAENRSSMRTRGHLIRDNSWGVFTNCLRDSVSRRAEAKQRP